MKKLILSWVVIKVILLTTIWFLVFAEQAPYPLRGARLTPTPTPASTDDKIDRPTSDPYKGDLARFDKENRAENLQIERVMDLLKIEEGAVVADIGAGGGWFTVIASKRVGNSGVVYAEDISRDSVEYVTKRAKKEGLENIRAVLGTPDDPKLPVNTIDSVLILNTYHEIAEPVAFLKKLYPALKKGALVGIIERQGTGDDHGVDSEIVKTEAGRAGYEYREIYDFVKKGRMDYFLVFSKK
jgi:SAM-dependent methyltransferase